MTERLYVASDEHLRGSRVRQDLDGPSTGMRVLELYARDLRIDVLLDRAGDIGRAEFRGTPVSWTSTTGYVPGWRGGGTSVAFLHSFPGGLLSTCGLEHIFAAEEEELDPGSHPHLQRQSHPLHGSLSTFAATVRAHGVVATSDGPVVFCEIETTQSVFFGPHLRLNRRIELREDRREIILADRIVNIGPHSSAVMVDYHANFGYPLVAEGATVSSPWPGDERRPSAPSQLVCPPPHPSISESVTSYPLDASGHAVELWSSDGRWGMRQTAAGDLIRHHVLWEYFQARQYVLGLEFASNDARGRAHALRSGELAVLDPGGSATNRLAWRFLVEGEPEPPLASASGGEGVRLHEQGAAK